MAKTDKRFLINMIVIVVLGALSGLFMGNYYVKNFNMYRYYLFDFLIHDFGCSRIFKNNVNFAGDIELKFADQFTTTPYLSGLWFKFSIGYCFRPSTKK